MFGLGPTELLVIGAIIFIIFGPGILKRTAKGIKESREVLRELEESKKEEK